MTFRLWGGAGRVPRAQLAVWAALAGSLSLAVVSLVWLASRAVGEWRHSTTLLVDQRSEEALTLLTVALSRDMKGVHNSVLAAFDESALDLARSYELEDQFAQAFARFPYPESFFVWSDRPAGAGSTMVFNRVDRQPPWATAPRTPGAYPVVSLHDPEVGRELAARSRGLDTTGQRFGAFEMRLAGVPYQVVVRLLYHTAGGRRLFGLVGFTVNLPWVNAHYFPDILGQISAIGDVEDSLSLAVADESGRLVARTRAREPQPGALHERRFPFSFLDPDLSASGYEPEAREWTASVSVADDRTLAAAALGSSRTLWLIALAAAAAVLGLLLTLRALRRSAELADMQSEFIASATHELKTPLALFQLVAETLAKGRYESADTIRTYAGMLSEQSTLLERLIDNLLAYASFGHVSQRYNLQPQDIAGIVETALERFDARLAATGTEARVELSPNLPPVRADRQALLQVFDNVIDNALKYSPPGAPFVVKAYLSGREVVVDITDTGPGISSDERDRVFEKFYRGKDATARGSGLGLAISKRVISDHRGKIEILDATPRGTTIRISIPVK